MFKKEKRESEGNFANRGSFLRKRKHYFNGLAVSEVMVWSVFECSALNAQKSMNIEKGFKLKIHSYHKSFNILCAKSHSIAMGGTTAHITRAVKDSS